MTITQSTRAHRLKLLVLGVVAFASMATSQADDPILTGYFQGPTIQLTADEPVFVQHVSIVANNEAFYGVQPERGFVLVETSLSGPATNPNCDNDVAIRLIPDNPEAEAGSQSFTAFLDCQPEEACETGFTLEVEHTGDACSLPVEVTWSVLAELYYPGDAQVSTYATIDIEFD